MGTRDRFIAGVRCQRRRGLRPSVPRWAALSTATGLTLLVLGVLPAPLAAAATDTVTTCASSGPGSLPAVVAAASAGDTVTFALAPPCSTITLSAPIDITTNLTMDGPGAASLAVEESTTADVFDVSSAVTAGSISGLTIEDGNIGIANSGTVTVTDSTITDNGSNDGGGIVNKGDLTVTGSTVSDNIIGVGDAQNGGGIDNLKGTVTLTDSTISDNAAANGANGGGISSLDGTVDITGSTLSGNSTGNGDGGGIYDTGGTITLADSTLAGNQANDGNGGGIDNEAGTVTVSNSTLIHNKAFYSVDGGGIYNLDTLTVSNSTFSANGAMYGGTGGDIYNGGAATVGATILANSAGGGDCSGPITDAGFNLDDDGSCGLVAAGDLSDTKAGLDPSGLAPNGGPTETIALEPTSAALSAVSNPAQCATPDQRGVSRPTPCDIGAVQYVLPPQAITSADNASATVGTPFVFDVTTSGTPAPSITKKGKLPKHVKLVKKAAGTADLSGTPKKAGVYHFTLEAVFGKSKTKNVVTQAFTLTVNPTP
jgi:hypothetical protein